MDIVNTFQASQILQCCKQTVREMLKRGQLRRVGNFRAFTFDRKLIERMPKVKKGRPPKQSR